MYHKSDKDSKSVIIKEVPRIETPSSKINRPATDPESLLTEDMPAKVRFIPIETPMFESKPSFEDEMPMTKVAKTREMVAKTAVVRKE